MSNIREQLEEIEAQTLMTSDNTGREIPIPISAESLWREES
jgi:hypothetical protein